MEDPSDFSEIQNITITGRIATGSTTLAKKLSEAINWPLLNGGALFREFYKEKGLNIIDAEKRPDDMDREYEEKIKKLLKNSKCNIIESHLAGFDAQGVKNVLKILVVCEDENGVDKTDIRIDRLVNRDSTTVEFAKHEVQERERQNLSKWRRLYAKNDPHWVYWDKKYYDLIVNTYSHNPQESLDVVLKALKRK